MKTDRQRVRQRVKDQTDREKETNSDKGVETLEKYFMRAFESKTEGGK